MYCAREVVAVHEAGHAIAFWYEGTAIRRIRLFGGAGGYGGTVIPRDLPNDYQTSALVGLAGPAAELEAGYEKPPFAFWERDFAHAKEACLLSGVSVDTEFERARSLVRAHQVEVNAIAALLMIHGELGGEAVRLVAESVRAKVNADQELMDLSAAYDQAALRISSTFHELKQRCQALKLCGV